MADINSVITYNANLSPAQAQIKALTTEIAGLTAAFNSLDKSALAAQRSLAGAFSRDIGNIGGFTTQTVKAHDAVTNFGKQLAANRLTMREYFREAFAGYTQQNSLMKQLAIQQVRLQQSSIVSTGAGQATVVTPNFLPQTSATEMALRAEKFAIFNKLVDSGATSMLNWGKNTQWAGRQLMVGFTVPLAMFAAVASKQFRDLDKELTRFQKVYGQDLGNSMSDATARMRNQVQQLAYDISKTYGIAAKDTAALAADIAATGAEGEKLLSTVQQTTRLSVLGEVDRQDAMKATLALQSAFKMNTNELADSINFLNAVENQTSTTLQDLTTAIPKVGPVVKSLGGDIKDLSLMLVAMREGGVPAAEAANALKSGLASLINPTQRASDVAKSYGINLKNIVESNKGQLMPTIFAVQQALSNLDSFSRSKVIEQIFGKYQFARMSALFENLGKAGSQTQSVIGLASKSSADLAGIANKEIRTLTESTSVKFAKAMENLKNAIIPIGQTLTETLIPIFDVIGKGVQAFSTFFQALPEPVKNFAKYGVAIAALAGPVIMLVGLFGNLIANGIKFGMMMVRLGARMSGLKFDKFQLLNEDVLVAKVGVDKLTVSFVDQETVMKRLVGVMSAYKTSLRELTTSNPALFVPSAIPATGGKVPIRRQSGSTSPEKVPGGYGGGDKIPALLEPGEMVVRKEAVSRYGSIISAMNRGNLPGFYEGTDAPVSIGAARYSIPPTEGARNPVEEGSQRGHIFGPAGAGMRSTQAKGLRIDNELFMWHRSFWIEMSQEENQLMNILSTGTRTNQPALERTLQQMNVSEQMIQQIMTKVRSGTMLFGQESAILHEAIKKMVSDLDTGTVGAREVSKKFLGLARPVAELPSLTSLTLEKLREAETKLISGLTSISTSSGPQAQQARQLLAEKLVLIRSLIQEVGQAPQVIATEIERILQIASPSRVFKDIGAKTSQGAIEGFKGQEKAAKNAGSKLAQEMVMGISTVSGRMMGPVGAGIESISNAQKIAQAEQSILKLTEKQLPFTAQRVRTEIEIAATLDRIAAIKADESLSAQERLRQVLAENSRLSALQSELENAKKVELQAQKSIDEQKQRIANADAAQARAEEEEAKIAQRRAAASIGIGPGGSAGWLMGGISPYQKAKTPDWLRSRMDEAQKTAKGMPTGPSASLATARATSESSSMRGMGAMNAMFAISMLTSSITMVSGASEDAAAKLGMFTTALMTATMLMNSGISGKGLMTNFLGLGSLGNKAMVTGRAMNIAAAAEGGISRGGMALMGLGRGLSVLGGPVGIAAGIGITAAITGFMMYKQAAEEARDRAIAAFNDPVKSAEYFGTTIQDVSKIIENNRLSNVSKDLQGIDQALREVVKQDYAPLIEQIKYLSAGAGAQELSTAYSNMIISGMSAENAKATIEAIAAEAGTRGGAAFTEAMTQGFLDQSITIKDAISNIIGQFAPSKTTYGNTGNTLLSEYNKEAKIIQDQIDKLRSESGLELGQTFFPDWMLNDVTLRMKELERSLDAVRDRIEDLLKINPDMIAQVMDSLTIAYQQDPTAAIEGLKTLEQTINSLSDGDKKAAIDKITEYLKNNYGDAWTIIGSSIDTDTEKILAAQMAIAGISFDKAINSAGEFDQVLAQTLITAKQLADEAAIAATKLQEKLTKNIDKDVQKRISTLNTEISNIQDNTESVIKSYERRKKQSDKTFAAEQENSQNTIDALQNEMDARTRIFDKEIQQLDDKSKAIQETSDAYIKSLQKNSQAETFYAQQRKTSLSALQKLASGDVFGYLQERQQMSTDAQQYSYDQMIKSIEDRRDLELKAIEEIRSKKEQEQKDYQQMMSDRIKAEQDLMNQQQKAHDQQMQNIDKQIKQAERERDKRVQAKRDEIKEINTIIDNNNGDLIKAQQDLAEKYQKFDQYRIQRENLEKLKIRENWYRGGVTYTYAAAMAGIPASTAFKYMNDLGVVGPDAYYKGLVNTSVPDTGVGNVVQQVQDMTVTATNVTVNGGGSGSTSGPPPGANPNNTYPAEGGGVWIYQNGAWTIQKATGGYISGPGGPKSDIIPALLSNGEYVVQASSVGKYGKSMMDAINAGRYAAGGYISADRAEYNASHRPTYFGGTPTSSTGYNKPGPTYSGGTPTYSGGYTSANQQGLYKPNKKWKIGGGNFGRPGIDYPSFNAPSFKQEVGSLWDSLRVGLATITDSFAAPFLHPFGIKGSLDQTTALGRFIGGNPYTQGSVMDRAMSAMGLFPFGKGQPRFPKSIENRFNEAAINGFREKRDSNRFMAESLWSLSKEYPEAFASKWATWDEKTRLSWVKNNMPGTLSPEVEAWHQTYLENLRIKEQQLRNQYGYVPKQDVPRREPPPRQQPPPRREPPPRQQPPPRQEPPPRQQPPPRPSSNFTGPTIKPGVVPNPLKEGRINSLLQKAFHPSTPRPEAELAYSKAKEMADKYGYNIPARPFAYGGLVRAKNGTYISADRAEYNASRRPTYSGGTPTYSGGYTSANTQATQTSGYKPKVWNQPRIKTGGGIIGDMIFESLRSDFANFITQYTPDSLDNLIGMNLSGDRSYSQTSQIDRAIGAAMFAANFIPGIGMLPFGAKTAAESIPLLSRTFSKLIQPRTIVHAAGNFDHNAAATEFFGEGFSSTPSSYLPNPPEVIHAPQTRRVVNVPSLGSKGPVDFSKGYAFWKEETPSTTNYYVSGSNEIGSPGAVAKVTKPQTSYTYHGPGYVLPAGRRPAGIQNGIDQITEGGVTRIVAGEGYHGQLGLFDITHTSPQLTYLATNPQYSAHVLSLLSNSALSTKARYGETLFSDTSLSPHSLRIVDKFMDSDFFRTPDYISYNGMSAEDFRDFVVANPDTALAMGNRVSQIPENNINFASALGRQALRMLRPEKPIKYTLPITGETLEFKNKAALMDFLHMLNNRFLPYANGGLVNKYAKGGKAGQVLIAPNQGLEGIFSLLGQSNTTDNTTIMPNVGTTGTPGKPSSTSTPFPGGGGPNGWPYSGFPLASGTIPGTSVSIQMNKDVLPLFLAFASDYNKLIRPIQPSITGGYRGVDPKVGNASNHPSGTALDTNWNQEGSHYSIFLGSEEERQANYNWWMGKKSALAPWKSISPVPYKTMNALMSKYKVLQWFGPAKLGGPSWLDWTSSDPMHVQINQDTDPSPTQVAQTIADLGINQDGTFNHPTGLKNGGLVKTFASGGSVYGPGGPMSDVIPAMLSNGEYVVKASSVNKYGKGFMDHLNAGNLDFSGVKQYANGGFVGAAPTFGMPQVNTINPSDISAHINNNYGASHASSVRNSNKVNVIINGAGGKSANTIANRVISIINQANGRRNHSRSA